VLSEVSHGNIGEQSEVLFDPTQALTLTGAQQAQREGRFVASTRAVLNPGIGSSPLWVHFTIVNPDQQPRSLYLVTGVSWIDFLEGTLLSDGAIATRLSAGDTVGPAHLIPTLGYTWNIRFPPGTSEIYLRAATPDPMLLPLELMDEPQLHLRQGQLHYSYGFIYGFVLAICAYYGALYLRLRERSYMYYAVYLLSLITMNIAYTGHGFAWFWPSAIGFQRYVILISMVVFCATGLLFASQFLNLREHAPRTKLGLQVASIGTLGLLAAFIALDWHLAAVKLAFYAVAAFVITMVAIGAFAFRRGNREGRYFLAAAICGLAGVAATTLSVWGVIPYSSLAYHGVEGGMMLEAILWALALGAQVEAHKRESLNAFQLASHDPLTSLRNRRGFSELAKPIWSGAVRSRRPISIVMIDVDKFKTVNDRFGHSTGDRALGLIGQIAQKSSRGSDVVARWGGEEFVVILPDTTEEQAHIFAERTRLAVEATVLNHRGHRVLLTISLGIAQRIEETSIEELIARADEQLYAAKAAGRNRVHPVAQAVQAVSPVSAAETNLTEALQSKAT
jgi:two-component system, sensor histidine kinase LadS